MSPTAGSRSDACHVLDEDRALAEAVPAEHRERAVAECIARTVSIPEGLWSGADTPVPGDGIGLLVLDGLLIRRVGIDRGFGAELLGAGDLLRPWQGADEPPILPQTTGWRVLQATRMAVLDEPFARRLARYPQLTGQLVGRALARSRNLAVNMAIVHQPRVETRLHMLLWHLAGRWGKVRNDGVIVPLGLTHNVLADLTAARRPTVTTALTELAKRSSYYPSTTAGCSVENHPASCWSSHQSPRPSPPTPRQPIRSRCMGSDPKDG